MKMNMKTILAIAIFLLILSNSSASTIARSFSSTTVQPGADLTVTLTVSIDAGETYYSIDELLPNDWTVENAGTAATEHKGHLKWVVIENAASTKYAYTLKAPSRTGTASFSGIFMFEGMENEAQITGQKQVTIRQSATTVQGNENIALYTLLAVCAIAAIAAAMIILKKKKHRKQQGASRANSSPLQKQ